MFHISPSRIALFRIALFRIVLFRIALFRILFRIVTVAAALGTVLSMANGCSAPPAPREAKTRSPEATSASGAAPDVVTFADGAGLTTDSDISWGDGLPERRTDPCFRKDAQICDPGR
ncbi:hypothetical protein [Microbacterium sp. MYb62]|uniref:hypothetical protein n=1 Tax=Microbacterium sp. MYb62 TaxID=1848690 RepID=UPI0015E3CD5F|nr:hypothetical protein [Microbacterium sp. MYb62]